MIYAILFIALIFRLILIDQSFWLDEAASLIVSRQDIPQLISSMGGEFHPPLFHFITHAWLKFGIHSEWFLRLPSVFFGIGTIYCLYLIILLLKPKDKFVALTAALFLALNPLHIYYSQELRMYSLSAFLTSLSWLFVLRLTEKSFSNKLFLLLGLTNLLNIYSFYGSFFSLFAQAIFFLIFHLRYLPKFLLFTSLFSLLYLPWVPMLISQLKGGQWLTTTLPGWSAVSGALSPKSLFLIPAKFSLGRINFSTNKLYLLAAFSVTFYFLSLILLSIRTKVTKSLFAWLIFPLILAIIVSIKTPILGYWRYIFILPAFVGLIALGVSTLPSKLKFLNTLVISITFILLNLLFYTTPAFQRENWKKALTTLSFPSDSVSIFAFSDAFAPVRWYAKDIPYSAVLKSLKSDDPIVLDLALNQAVQGKKTIYYFEYLSSLTDPSANIKLWLNNAGYKLSTTHNFSGVGFIYEYQGK